jgi:NAD(P)-dependent dehydrogenase (short-subunit alcohol dehydrogenase family)
MAASPKRQTRNDAGDSSGNDCFVTRNVEPQMAVAPTSARVATSVCVLFGAGVGTSPWSGAEGADNKDRSESKRLVERSGALKSPALGTIYMRPGFARNNAQVDHTVATNLVGSIQLIRSASSPQFPRWRPHHSDLLPRGQVAFPGTRCTTLRRLVSRVVESVAQEVAPFGTGMTIVEPGGARTEFRYGSPRSPSSCRPRPTLRRTAS